MIKKVFFVIVLLFFFSGGAWAQVTEHVLPNGLKVIVVEDHKAPLAIIEVWYRVGSRNEEEQVAGISHLLEHMMFKGTKKYGPAELSKIVQRNGGQDNAYTSQDQTVYFQELSSDRVELAFQLEADRMQNLRLDPKETLSERDVVMEERRLRFDDDPQNSLYEEVISTSIKAHPYHWPVIGWMSTIKDITPEALKKYYESYYSPSNAVLIVAGDVNPGATIKLAEKYFGKVPRRPETEKHPIPAEPPQNGIKRVYLKKEAEMPYMIAAYHVPALPNADAYALEVLAGILSGGKSARFYSDLVYQKQIALWASADYDGLQKDPFLFMADGTPAMGHTAEELEKEIRNEIERIKKEPPSEFELTKAKNQIESGFLMGQDSIHFQAEITGKFEMIGGWRMKDEYIPGIRKVTAEDVSRVANKYLSEDNLTVGILVPIKTNAPKEAPKEAPMEQNVR